MSEVTVEITSVDDWKALYIDGDKKLSGHSLPIWEIFEELSKAGLLENVMFLQTDYCGTKVEDDLFYTGDFPQKRWEIKEI